MSIISSRSAKSRQGFMPYQSEQGDLRQISLFSRLNLNDHVELQQVLPHLICNKSASDLLSVGSKKRKLSQELMNSSKAGGNKTFLNRSLVGKSSLNGELLMEMDSSYNPKKELSENSCPVVLNGEENIDLFSEPEITVEKQPRFAKTKNLLRNLSNYMHKFVLYNPRAHKWVRYYFASKLRRNLRKMSNEKSQSYGEIREDSNSSSMIKEEEQKAIPKVQEQKAIPKVQEQKAIPKVNEEEIPKVKEEENEGKVLSEQQEANIRDQAGDFFSWIGELSIGNFNDYENIWTKPHKFRALYRTICYKYYRSEAYCDIMRSRLTTKEISVQYLVQFIEGILNPAQFYRFK